MYLMRLLLGTSCPTSLRSDRILGAFGGGFSGTFVELKPGSLVRSAAVPAGEPATSIGARVEAPNKTNGSAFPARR